MTAASLDDQLASVQAAIAKIEGGGQDVTYDGKRNTRADLKTLYAREDVLLRQIARAANGGIVAREGSMK
jgi:hypothetical protein